MRGRRRGSPEQDRWQRRDYWGVVLSTPDVARAARFWSELLGWPVWKIDEGGAALDAGEGVAYLSFELDVDHVRPVWPSRAGSPQMQLHLDFEVEDLEAAVAHALELGAEPAAHQPREDLRVLLDPDGHPFCLYT